VTEPLPERALRRLLDVAAAETDPAAGPPPPFLPERYEVRGELGRGGMGIVYEALDRQLDRLCAVKMLGPQAGADDEGRRRFVREALATARLRHPHIAAIYDATPDYISMQRIVGAPLDAIDPAERRLLVELVRDAARAVHHAHEQGIVHRDLKPSNLLVEGRHVYVVDFGLAKATAIDASRSLPGAVLGTPAFMPPEQALGRSDAIDARSDVYALGATLYRCLCGAPPFAHTELPALLRAIAEDEPRPPRVERDLDLVVLRCLGKEPERRYPSAAALADDLDRWLRDEPVEARRPSLGYRLRKHLQRRGALVRAAALAALAAVGLTAIVLVPIVLRARAERQAASEAVALSQRAATVLQDAEAFTLLGDLASAQEALDRGIAGTRAFLQRHDVPRVRHLLSRLLRARGQPDRALDELGLAIRGDPSLAEARFERGLVLAARFDLDADARQTAIADLSTPVGADSVLTGIDVLFGRAERERLCGNHATAMELLEEVLAYEPAHVQARTSLAQVALALGDTQLARYWSVSAVDLQQGYGPVYFAREHERLPTTILGLDAALVDFAGELAGDPANLLALARRSLVQLRRALRLEAEGHPREALLAIEGAVQGHDAALQVHRDLPGALNNRAVCLMQAQRLYAANGDSAAAGAARARAAADLDAALAAAPTLPEAHMNRGVLLLRNADLLRRLARAAAARTSLSEAVAALRRALELAPADWPHARACQARLAAGEATRAAGG
jgi:tetratricopeptide (TPR) repeat protein/predicted Ser/Thr protein kinase